MSSGSISLGTAPGWVRLVREGSLFSAYQSQDGSSWTLLGTDTIVMPATVYVGLAVTSKSSTAVATAMFSNVSIGSRRQQQAAHGLVDEPDRWCGLHHARDHLPHSYRRRCRRHHHQVDFYAGATLRRVSIVEPVRGHLEQRRRGELHAHRGRDRQQWRDDDLGPVTITVSANKAPTVSLTTPVAGASFTAPASVAMSAAAADTDGTIAKLDFYAGATLVGSATSSPYTVSWTNVAAGTYSLTAIATDNAGARRRPPWSTSRWPQRTKHPRSP